MTDSKYIAELEEGLIRSVAVESARRMGGKSRHISAVISQYMAELRNKKAPCAFDFVDDYIKNNNDVTCSYAGKSGATGICVDPDL